MDFKKILPIIGIIILFYILFTLDTEKIIDVFLSIDLFYGLLSTLAIIPIVLLVNYEWQLILKKHNIHVSYRYSLKNIFIGYFYGFITPGGLGGYTRVFYLRDESGETIQKCFVNLLILGTIDYIASLSIGIIGGFLLISRIPIIFPIFLSLFIVTVILLALLIRKETGKILFTRLLRLKSLTPYKEKLHIHFDSLYEDIPAIKDLIPPYIISIIGWFIFFSEFYFISLLFSINVPYHYFIFIIAISHIISMIPITIYGLGTREAVLIFLFSIFNVAQENVLGFSLFLFVISWLIPSIIGACIAINETRKKPAIS